jgi:signal transduction histidine kinase
MMRRTLLLCFVGVLGALTFLLQRAGAPDEVRHERVLAALRTIDLMNASLQRDVLRARTGLLTDYDVISAISGTLRRQAELLTEEVPALRPQTAALQAALDEQDDRLERFKTQNALVQNSRRVFESAIRELIPPGNGALDPAASGIIHLAASVLRLASAPPASVPAEVLAEADRLAALPDAGRYATLVAHARLIASALPAINASLMALQEGPVVEPAQRFHEAYLQAYAETSARARLFRLALYSAAIALAAYTLFLVLRLERNAQLLRRRLALETLVAQTSAGLLNPLPGEFDGCISPVLARIAEYFGAERVRIVVRDGPDDAASRYEWHHQRVTPGEAGPELLQVLESWPAREGGMAGIAIVPDVAALAPGPARELLQRLGLRSWIAAAIGTPQHPHGMLSLECGAAPMASTHQHAIALYTLANLFGAAFAREQATAEQEALRTRLAHAERLEALGTLAGGIAHEFNNALGSMLGHAELALDILKRDSAPRRYVAQILASGAQAKAVVDQILTFSRAPTWRREPFCPQPVVEEALEMIRVSLPPGVALHLAKTAPEAVVDGDAVGLRQIVVNLGRNAAQAMGEQGRIEVSCDTVSLRNATTLSHGTLPAGAYFRLAVADTGSGIPPALVARIFEPFFTTKGFGQGTGLGLAVIHGIVTDHGGALDIRSRMGAGTTFFAYLPLTEARPLAQAKPMERAVPKGAGEAILLVEPDRQRLLLAEEMVAALGYEPVGVESTGAAWGRLQAAPAAFDLVLAANDAPGGGAVALAQRAHGLNPLLPVILMAGMAEGSDLLQRKPAGIAEVVLRPLQFRALAELLERHLARHAAQSVGGRS